MCPLSGLEGELDPAVWSVSVSIALLSIIICPLKFFYFYLENAGNFIGIKLLRIFVMQVDSNSLIQMV